MLGSLFRSLRRTRRPHRPNSQASIRAEQSVAQRSSAPPQFNPKVQWWSNRQWLDRYERHIQPDAINGCHAHRILDRRFTLTELAKVARSLRGSTADCGVFKG